MKNERALVKQSVSSTSTQLNFTVLIEIYWKKEQQYFFFTSDFPGIYMLQMRGKEIPEETEVNDQAFLMMIMEKNEEVENAETAEDILNLNMENKELINKLQKDVSQAFYDGDLQLVIKLLSQMKYYTSIDQQIQNLIRSKGIIR